MKIAIGLISTIFGILLAIYVIIKDATYYTELKAQGIGMMFGGPNYGLGVLVAAILIVLGCVVLERGIEEK